MTGRHLKDADVSTDNMGQIVIAFELTDEGAQIFRDYTLSHVGDIVAIILDKRVLSAPVINEPITSGKGVISSGATGGFPLEEARSLASQMKYGALPVPLKVMENRTIGPSLGRESIARSIQAGLVGLIVVLLFMVTYYRLPGLLADMALIIYALINVALYKLIPVTLTLPAITGFILSTGMAVDANILVFERMKEELRSGRALRPAIEAGFSRAWTSIRDSNISTLLTCAILFWFGSNFGASIVKGFAITLALGVVVNLFTAIFVTRTFIRFVFTLAGDRLREKPWLLGV
jgi:protein-export membrane protein SecD